MSNEVVVLDRPVDDLPEGWTQITLGGALAKSEGGGTPPRDVEEYWNGDIPWASVKDVVKGEGSKPEETITPAGLANSTSKLILAGTNILVARMGVGAVVRYPFPVAINQDLMALTPSSELDPGFLFYWLQARKDAFVAVATGTTVKGIRKDVLLSFPILLPPLDEQLRIAEVLRSLDEAIARTKVAVEQASRAIQGMLQRLFIEGIGHSDFKDGRSTPIPASWDEKSLGELTVTGITYGVVQPGPDIADGIPFVRGGDFPNGKIDIGSLRKISKDVASQYRRTQLKGGEIVVSLVGYPGACAMVPAELAGANVARQAALIRPSKDIVARYLYQFLRSPIGQERLKKETIGSAQQVINLRDLKEVMVAIPPKHEQEKIAATLSDLDAYVELETANLDKLIELKCSIATDLLSGRVRVPA